MTIKYNEDLEKNIIWYEENGFRFSFTKDESNLDYQIYLKKHNALLNSDKIDSDETPLI